MATTVKKISVTSLATPDHTGWMTKQGGSWKSWKKRYFVLKGSSLYYFKSRNDTDVTGIIPLTQESFVRKEPDKKGKKNLLSVGTTTRVYFMYPETEAEQLDWFKHIELILENIKNGAKDKDSKSPPSTLKTMETSGGPRGDKMSSGEKTRGETSSLTSRPNVRQLLINAKDEVAFLESEDSKVLEFWQIWLDSIPPPGEIDEGGTISFEIAISGDMEKLTWKASGPQHIFIQKMVDFFWNVGAPETEIDRLNDVGAIINPIKIGSWIDMSAKGGMDGGWFFPSDVAVNSALEAGDPGDPITKVLSWSQTNGVEFCTSVGRDMGAAPPRQTEIRILLAGNFEQQLRKAVSAYSDFGFPQIPEEALELLKQAKPPHLCMSVITSSEGFVRLGVLAPDPPKGTVESLCNLSGGNTEQLLKFEHAIGVRGPAYVEFQFLVTGFGYGVYKEGFDIIFHYKVGEESGPLG